MTNITLLSDMKYKILSQGNIKITLYSPLNNYKQLKFYYLQANIKYNVVWSTKYNIGDNIFEIS